MSQIQKILERAERDGAIRPAEPGVGEPAPPPAVPSDTIFADAPVAEAPAGTAVEAEPSMRRMVTGQLDPRLYHVLAPESASNEQYRALRTRIHQAANGRGMHALLVTSPGRREGRTQTAAGLALVMAQEFDRRVCVVDADLRRPGLREVLGLPAGPGLIDVLTGQAPLEQALIHLDDQRVTVLPGGAPTAQVELLGTAVMRRVLQALRATFDRVVLDAPPAMPAGDVALLSPVVDSLLLVVRAGVTATPAVHRAIETLDSDKLLGLVLNDAR